MACGLHAGNEIRMQSGFIHQAETKIVSEQSILAGSNELWEKGAPDSYIYQIIYVYVDCESSKICELCGTEVPAKTFKGFSFQLHALLHSHTAHLLREELYTVRKFDGLSADTRMDLNPYSPPKIQPRGRLGATTFVMLTELARFILTSHVSFYNFLGDHWRLA